MDARHFRMAGGVTTNMCWKQSWAHAINNLGKAIVHIENAQEKLKKRRERNEAALEKSHEPVKVKERITKNIAGIEQCEKLIADLQEDQDELFKMIHKYGLSRAKNQIITIYGTQNIETGEQTPYIHPEKTLIIDREEEKRVYKLMGKYPYTEKLKELL